MMKLRFFAYTRRLQGKRWLQATRYIYNDNPYKLTYLYIRAVKLNRLTD